ncbi:hypothetical protein MASR2M78_01530 [Treponema sp.]
MFSGPDTLTPYIDGGEGSWLDLRLFQGSKTLHAESIQRIIVSSRFDPPSGLQERSYTLARSVARPWILEGNEGLVLDSRKVETYAKAIAEAESDDFAFEKDFEVQASIRLETGNAQSYQIILGPPFQERFRLARLASSERVFLLSHWTVESLFPSLESLSTSNNAVSYEKSP